MFLINQVLTRRVKPKVERKKYVIVNRDEVKSFDNRAAADEYFDKNKDSVVDYYIVDQGC